ncbi:MAG: L,D-transpeptidase family protein [Deltaproteobacteria bacterium]|nr:L,D-transpeptidase family protein [Deltaproteobacteria bacterium]
MQGTQTDRARRWPRRVAAAVLLLAAASCGLVGVCEPSPDLGASTGRVPHAAPPAAGAVPLPHAEATWDGGGEEETGDGEPRLRSNALVPGVSAYEKMNVFERPDYNSARIGYLRRGVRVLVRGPVDAPDCGDNSQKWFQLEEGGYVCAGRGLLIGAPLSEFLYVPPPPDFEGPVPYRYAKVRRDRTPVYKHAPTREEITEVTDFLFPPPPGADADAEPDGDAGAEPADPDAGAAEPPPVVDNLGDLEEGSPLDPGAAGAPITPPTEPPVATTGTADAGAEDGEVEDAGMSDADRELLQRGPRHRLLVRVLMSGFTVAYASTEHLDNRTWYRTLDGGYVDGEALAGIDARSDRIGMVLDGTKTLPVGIVAGRSARAYAANERGEIAATGTLPKFASFAIVAEETRGDRVFWKTSDGTYVSRQQGVVVVEKLDPPRAVGQWDKWIVVDLTKQTLTAYEGTVPVFVTLVSTGKEGYETPRGVFRILSKHISNPMDDFALGEPYAIDEVPYVMYFQQNVALHGAFWHRGFGAVRSHGCVNLPGYDAHWLFDWVHPFRPEGWHGVYATDTDPGTIVWVRKGD